jgi:3-hydroxybutyryl-CoA dehydratase
MFVDSDRARPGTPLPPIVIEVSQERINRYADLSGDYNPLHVDPEFARQTPFGGTIAHGPLAGALLFRVVSEWLGSLWLKDVDFEFTFVAPVRAGDLVTASGTVQERCQHDMWEVLRLDLRCTNQLGETVIVGLAQVPIA